MQNYFLTPSARFELSKALLLTISHFQLNASPLISQPKFSEADEVLIRRLYRVSPNFVLVANALRAQSPKMTAHDLAVQVLPDFVRLFYCSDLRTPLYENTPRHHLARVHICRAFLGTIAA